LRSGLGALVFDLQAEDIFNIKQYKEICGASLFFV